MAETRRKKQAARLHGRVEEISEILKLLGNPQRLLIASLLCEGEYAVSEIEVSSAFASRRSRSNSARCGRPV
jgi:hypothetical protein